MAQDRSIGWHTLSFPCELLSLAVFLGAPRASGRVKQWQKSLLLMCTIWHRLLLRSLALTANSRRARRAPTSGNGCFSCLTARALEFVFRRPRDLEPVAKRSTLCAPRRTRRFGSEPSSPERMVSRTEAKRWGGRLNEEISKPIRLVELRQSVTRHCSLRHALSTATSS
jgi:hypothetical protein